MAIMRKLSTDEVTRLQQPSGRVDLTPYSAAIQDLTAGDWGLITLGADDRVSVVKRRYSLAARGQGKRLVYKRLRSGTIPFEVRLAVVAPPPPPPAKPARRAPATRSKPAAAPARATRSTRKAAKS